MRWKYRRTRMLKAVRDEAYTRLSNYLCRHSVPEDYLREKVRSSCWLYLAYYGMGGVGLTMKHMDRFEPTLVREVERAMRWYRRALRPILQEEKKEEREDAKSTGL